MSNQIKRYVLHVYSCVDPSLKGPYKTTKSRDNAARRLRNASDEDGVFWLNVDSKGNVNVGSYSGGFMNGLDGFEGSEG